MKNINAAFVVGDLLVQHNIAGGAYVASIQCLTKTYEDLGGGEYIDGGVSVVSDALVNTAGNGSNFYVESNGTGTQFVVHNLGLSMSTSSEIILVIGLIPASGQTTGFI